MQMWVSGVTVSLHVRMLEMLKKKKSFYSLLIKGAGKGGLGKAGG